MKRSLIFAAAVAALSLSTLSAQTFEAVRVHFDQQVQVAGNTLPAGDYSITMIKSNADVPLLRFSSAAGANAVVFASRAEHQAHEVANHTEVILEKSGSGERVTCIEIEGSSSDLIVPSGHQGN
jgi:hypothetical protein